MLTRCCLRRGYERSPKGLWSCRGRLLARAGRSRARSGRRLGDLGRLLGRLGSLLGPLGALLERSWEALGRLLGGSWTALDDLGSLWDALKIVFGRFRHQLWSYFRLDARKPTLIYRAQRCGAAFNGAVLSYLWVLQCSWIQTGAR